MTGVLVFGLIEQNMQLFQCHNPTPIATGLLRPHVETPLGCIEFKAVVDSYQTDHSDAETIWKINDYAQGFHWQNSAFEMGLFSVRPRNPAI